MSSAVLQRLLDRSEFLFHLPWIPGKLCPETLEAVFLVQHDRLQDFQQLQEDGMIQACSSIRHGVRIEIRTEFRDTVVDSHDPEFLT